MKSLVIGTGGIARRHMENLRTVFPNGEIGCVSVTGRNLERTDVNANVCFSNLEKGIFWGPELAIIASPATHHLDQAKKLVENKIPVLIEKPLCAQISDNIDEIKFLSENHQFVEIGYNLRFLSSSIKMKEILTEQIIGKILHIQVDTGQFLPSWRPEKNYRETVSAQKSLGGGVLLELSHELDYLNWLFGDFKSVFCSLRTTNELDVDVEDMADLLLSSSEGLQINVHLDFLRKKANRICRIIGTEGTLLWDLIADEIKLEVEKKLQHCIIRKQRTGMLHTLLN